MSAAVRWKFIDIELADFHPGDKWRTASSTAAVLFVKPAASPHRSPEKSLEFFLRSNLAQEELREKERRHLIKLMYRSLSNQSVFEE